MSLPKNKQTKTVQTQKNRKSVQWNKNKLMTVVLWFSSSAQCCGCNKHTHKAGRSASVLSLNPPDLSVSDGTPHIENKLIGEGKVSQGFI